MFRSCLDQIRPWILLCALTLHPAITGRTESPLPPPDFSAATTHAASFQLAPDLNLEVWAAEPQLHNPVAFSFDRLGRAYIAETHRYGPSVFDITQRTNWLVQDLSFRSVDDRTRFLEDTFALEPDILTRDSEKVRLVYDPHQTGRATHSQIIATGFNTPADGTAAGVLVRDDTLWFGNIPNLWQMKIASNSPSTEPFVTQERTSLAFGFGVHIGVTGHDLHGLILGPDGRLYMSFGDRGANIRTHEGVDIHLPDTGGVLRCEPDGSHLEVFCMGLRNPQELAFDDDGNLWTVDNDTAGADKCRVLHLVEGADYGWRAGYQYMDGFGPWVKESVWTGIWDGVLPSAGLVSQGPSGLAWYPGVGFGDRLKGHFLHCDFPGGVWSFTVRPHGASFVVDTKDRFLWNLWPTDIAFGPDGAAYVLDWVAGWQMPQRGRIYRITDPRYQADPLVAESRDILREGMAHRTTEELQNLSGHPHQWIRQEVREEWVKRYTTGTITDNQLERWVTHTRTASSRTARMLGLRALDQASRQLTSMSDNAEQPDVGARVARLTDSMRDLEPMLTDPDPILRTLAARVLVRTGSENIRSHLISMISDTNATVAFHAIQTLTQLNSSVGSSAAPHAIGGLPILNPLINRLQNLTQPDPYLQLATVRWVESAIANAQQETLSAELVEALLSHPDATIRRVLLLAWRRLQDPAIAHFLSDPDPRLVTEAGRAIHDAPITEAFVPLAQLINRVDAPPDLLSRSIQAAFRLGTQQHAQMLASLATRIDVPESIRADAIRALASWPVPPVIDPILGTWHPAIPASSESMDKEQSPQEIPTPALPPHLGPLARAAAARNMGRVTDPLPLPKDLGRSVAYLDAIGYNRNPVPARRAFLRVAGELLDPFQPDETGLVLPGKESLIVQLAIVDAAVSLETKEVAHPLFKKLSETNVPSELRRRIVPALAALNAYQTPQAVELALEDEDPDVSNSALPFMDRLEGERSLQILQEILQPILSDIGNTSPPSVPTSRSGRPGIIRVQGAFAALTHRSEQTAKLLLLSALQRLVKTPDTLPAEVHLDILEAARSSVGTGDAPENRAIESLLQEYGAQAENQDANPWWHLKPALHGGDAARGRDIFFNNSQVQCLRCHQVGNNGGTVGPKLDGTGARDRMFLLESIVDPNKAFTEGYVPPEDGLSAMPEGFAEILTAMELRDLIAWLSSLR